MAKKDEAWEDEGRTFVRSVDANNSSISEQRVQLRELDRVRRLGGHSHFGGDAPTPGGENSYIAPSDAEFLSQSVNAYLFELAPQSSNRGHGHQNEALFYILEGEGYDIHDGVRYDWKAGDCLVIHNDCVHRHFNPTDKPVRVLVIKAKAIWYFLGLTQDGNSYAPWSGDNDRYGERLEWDKVWTEGHAEKLKVIKPTDREWQTTPFGKVRDLISSALDDVRLTSVDAMEIEVPAGGRTGRRWKMADEAIYVLSGSGYSLHWDVEAEIDDKYYARVAREPTRYEFKKDDILYVPTNTVVQHFADKGAPVRLLSTENRIFKQLGYDNVHYLESAPELSLAQSSLEAKI